ncbi:MAG: type VI secretion system tip protein VgrG [Chromatiales bacterium]|nr:type VI secretion system tip protein VgrG [Chromatiales bacterium]
MTRVMEIMTPLGADVLLFHRMRAREEMGRLFEYEIDLLSKKGDVDLDKILAKSVTVKLELPEQQDAPLQRLRHALRPGRHASGATICTGRRVRPWLWFLTRGTNCRIFQEMTVPDILKKVFDEYSIQDVKLDGLTGTYAKRDYCVQYRESDFNFVSRLMEDEGIYYFFKHADGKHKPGAGRLLQRPWRLSRATSTIPFYRPGAQRAHREGIHPRLDLRCARCSRASSPSTTTTSRSPRPSCRSRPTRSAGTIWPSTKIYDYPGSYVADQRRRPATCARAWRKAQYQFELASGKTNARGLSVGYLFDLSGHARERPEPRVRGAGGGLRAGIHPNTRRWRTPAPRYACSFQRAGNSQQAFRPQRPTRKPFVQGPQTAVVVGPSGDEIYTDKYGRVKVQFHWDRLRQERREQLRAGCACRTPGRARTGAWSRSRASARKWWWTSWKATRTSR